MKRNAKNLKIYKAVCKDIWNERPHRCEFCDEPIGQWDMELGENVPEYINFQHTERGRGEDVWINKEKIKLICKKCHLWQDQKLTLKT